jgi:hypothetical protein
MFSFSRARFISLQPSLKYHFFFAERPLSLNQRKAQKPLSGDVEKGLGRIQNYPDISKLEICAVDLASFYAVNL